MVSLHLNDTVMKSLSNNELNILKYVYGHAETVLDMSIQAVAKQVSYSPTTVLRFCKKLGYSGFAEFKYALRAELRDGKLPPTANREQLLSTKMMIDSLCSNVEGTANLIQEDQLSRTFRYFDSNCPIYLWAPGGITSILADYFEKLLFSIGRQNVYKIESAKMGEHILRHISTPSILILISTTGDFGPTIRLAKLAQMNNVPVIAISPYANNMLASLAAINFRFFTHQRENLGAEFTSRLPVFFVINIIIQCYLQYKQSGTDPSESTEGFHDPVI